MSASFRGDFVKLAKLAQGLERLTGVAWRRALTKNLAQEAHAQVQECFMQSRDPYGKAWPPLQSRVGEPLRDTGRLMNSLRASSSTAGFTISTPVLYANVHNQGATLTAKPRTNIHRRSGRFMSREAAGRRRTAVRVSYSPEYSFTIPRRQFIPDADRHLPASWREGFLAVFRVMRDDALRGR